jgi:hypothetical protein
MCNKFFKFNNGVIVIYSIIFNLICGCSSSSTDEFIVSDPVALINFLPGILKKELILDYSNAIDSGFVIPSVNQTTNGLFKFSFKVKNTTSSPLHYYYKIIYRNESYKFNEVLDDSKTYNRLAAENFYGSWENNDSVKTVLIDPSKNEIIVDSFRIVGNPRNEKKYFGASILAPREKEVKDLAEYIRKDNQWFESIKLKAKKEKRSVEQQLLLDARYQLMHNPHNENNQRFLCNPRTGDYSFYLLVYNDKSKTNVPAYLKHLESPDSIYIDPVYYLATSPVKGIKMLKFRETLHVKAKPDCGAGIYIDKSDFPDSVTKKFYNPNCNSSEDLYHSAAFKQFVHKLPEGLVSPNIPVAADLQSADITMNDYKNYLSKYKPSDMLQKTNVATQCPCETVVSDKDKKEITMKTPGIRRNLKVKENTGVMSRSGFTYGTYTFKVKMPELLNKNNLWNGLTNALWLVNQKNETWNQRRPCAGKGYIPKEEPGIENWRREKIVQYTEIDFEIRKAHPYWPKTSYSPEYPRPTTSEDNPGKIMVTCTNWDLACDDPPLFNSGAHSITHNGVEHVIHRWTHWYQALTSKYEADDDELFAGDYYYFQIEWKPQSITWRIGPEKNNLREAGYMDDSVSSIPNNQMLFVFTQEYHISEWWPESPQLQEYIPFPAKDIIGKILEVEID